MMSEHFPQANLRIKLLKENNMSEIKQLHEKK